MFCSTCGSALQASDLFCRKCGQRQAAVVAAPTGAAAQMAPIVVVPKNPGLAAVLSFLMTGLGQIYNGEVGKGLAMLAGQVLNVLLMFVLIGLITAPALWIWSIVDAYQVADRMNRQVLR